MATTETIKSDGSGDYTTMQSWEDAVPATPTGGYIGEMYDMGSVYTGTLLIDGHTTSAVNFITLRAADNESFQDHANVRTNALYWSSSNGVAISQTGGAGDQFTINNDYVTIERLQIKRTGSAYGIGIIHCASNNQWNITVKDCILGKEYSYGYGAYVANMSNGRIINCVVYDTNPTTDHHGVRVRNEYNNGVPLVLNCTIIAVGGGGGSGVVVSNTGNNVKVQNCLIFGYGTSVNDGGGNPFATGTGYNGTNLASGLPGSNNQHSLTASTELVSATNDFRLKSGATSIGTGNTDATNAPNDISGTARGATTTGDIGSWEFASAGSSYTLTADQGSYALTGQAVGLRPARTIQFAQGSYALNGQSVGLRRGFTLAAAYATYTITGQAVATVANRRLTLQQGSYALTGQSIALRRDARVTFDQGSYALNGQSVSFTATSAKIITIDQGTYTLDGQAVNLKVGRAISFAQGSYALTGQATALRPDYRITLAQGSYLINGQEIGLVTGGDKLLTADPGSYSLNGQSVSLRASRAVNLEAGTYSLTGQLVTLHRAGKLAVDFGSYLLNGQDAGLRRQIQVPFAPGSYQLTGQDVAFSRSQALAAEFGTYTLTGRNVEFLTRVSTILNSTQIFVVNTENSSQSFALDLVNSEQGFGLSITNSEQTL
jgi:hypothetical protein